MPSESFWVVVVFAKIISSITITIPIMMIVLLQGTCCSLFTGLGVPYGKMDGF